jgi:outer membrane protein TolC
MILRQGAKVSINLVLLVCMLLSSSLVAYSQDSNLIDLDDPIKVNLEVNQLTMADAIKLALLNNPEVTIQQSMVNVKKWEIKEHQSYLFPQFYFREEFITSNNPVNAFMMKLNQRNLIFNPATINKPGAVSNFSTRVGGHWVLLDRSIYKKIDISKLEHELQKQIGKKAIHDLVYDVRKAYIDIKLAQITLANAQTNMEYAKSHYNAVKDKKSAGIASKSDYLSAKSVLSSAQESVIKAKNKLNLAWIVFADLLGDDSIVGYHLVDEMQENIQVDEIDKLVKYSYLHRPEVIETEKRKDKALIGLKLANATGALTIKTYGEWGVDTIFDDRAIAKGFTAGVTIDKKIFDGGLKKAKVEQAKANIDKHNAEIDQIYKKVKVDVVQNYLDLMNAGERLKMADDIVKDADESLRTYNERYLVGLASNVEVESAQANLAKSLLLRTHALHDFNKAVIELQRAIGMSMSEIIEGKNLIVTDVIEVEKVNERIELPDNKRSESLENAEDTVDEPDEEDAEPGAILEKTDTIKFEEININDDYTGSNLFNAVESDNSPDVLFEISPENADYINTIDQKPSDTNLIDDIKTNESLNEKDKSLFIQQNDLQIDENNHQRIKNTDMTSLELLSKCIIKG